VTLTSTLALTLTLSYTNPKVAPSLYLLTYPLATDKNAVTSVADYNPASKVADPRTHEFLDKWMQPCWTAKNTYSAMMDALRKRGYMTNALSAHSAVDKQKEYVHGETPTSAVYDELCLYMVLLIGSGRFSDVSIQGVLGRTMLTRGTHLLAIHTGEAWHCVSFDHDEVYQLLFSTEYLNAGMFHASDQEELLFFFSAGMPHGVFVSLDSSTTDPTGSKRLLRSAAANRQACFQRLYGQPTSTYGGKNSLVETLAQQKTMDAASSKFASFGAEGEMEESTRWRVPGGHGAHAKAKVVATFATAAMERAEKAEAEARLTPTPTPTLTLALTPTL
jgi:hypothetical protein